MQGAAAQWAMAARAGRTLQHACTVSAAMNCGDTLRRRQPSPAPHAPHLQPRVQLYLVDGRLDGRSLRQLFEVRHAKVAHPNRAD